MKNLISISLFISMMIGCGKENSSREAPTSIVGDTELQSEVASANLSEATDAAGDSNESSSTATSLDLGLANSFTRDRSCAVEGSSAVVTIKSSRSMSKSRENARNSSAASRTGSSSLIRTWSKDAASISCTADGKHAAIDFNADPTGLKLAVKFTRDDASTLSVTTKKVHVDKSSSYSASGTRNVQWTSKVLGSNGAYTLDKTVSTQSTRIHKLKDKNGVDQTITLAVSTPTDAPLTIAVSRTAEGVATSRLIKSGTLIAEGDVKVESKFENLLVMFSDDNCQPQSGKVTTSIFGKDATSASAIYQIEAADGDYTVTDITDPANPKEVENFNYEVCDVHNFDY